MPDADRHSADPTVTDRSAARWTFEVRWMSPSSGRWVASRRGDTLGTVERLDGSYRATSARGRELGVFDELDSARAAIDRRAQRRPRGANGVSLVTALLWGVIGGATVVALVLLITIFQMGG